MATIDLVLCRWDVRKAKQWAIHSLALLILALFAYIATHLSFQQMDCTRDSNANFKHFLSRYFEFNWPTCTMKSLTEALIVIRCSRSANRGQCCCHMLIRLWLVPAAFSPHCGEWFWPKKYGFYNSYSFSSQNLVSFGFRGKKIRAKQGQQAPKRPLRSLQCVSQIKPQSDL